MLVLLPLIASIADDETAPRAEIVNTIVIDPGHGGQDKGAVGAGGTTEKELTLAIAKRLRGLVLADPQLRRSRVRVVLTREDDTALTLEDRAAIANSEGGSLFISIHANSSPARSAYGAETYILSLKASDEHARKVAEIENVNLGSLEAAPDESDDLKMILFDVIHKKYIEESKFLAERIQAEFNARLLLGDRGVKQAPFRVLKGVAMPAVLVEVDFISNPQQERRMRSESYQQGIAESMLSAIKQYKLIKERGYASLSSGGAERVDSP